MLKVMKDRDLQIEGDKASSLNDRDAREQSLQEIDRTLRSARQEAEKARGEIEGEAFKEKSRLIAEVNAASRLEIEQAKAALNVELARLKTELGGQAEFLANKIETRLLN
jgi:F0F1-type ATP synthase membrane subunit b/b'